MRSDERYLSAQLTDLLLSWMDADPDAVRKLLRESGEHPGAALNPHARIGAERFFRMLCAPGTPFHNMRSGLPLAERVNVYRSNHLLMSMMSHCETLEQALQKLIRYHDIASNAIKLRLRRESGTAVLLWTADIPVRPQAEQLLVEAAVAACAVVLREITAGKAAPESVRFAYPRQPDIEAYRKFFGCPVLFGQAETGISLHDATLRLPIAMADPALLAVLEEYAKGLLPEAEDADGFTEQVLRIARETLVQGRRPDIQTFAKRFAVSVRTLQKRLKTEGTGFRKLLETAKKDIAVRSLRQTSLPLTDIAFLLGFSEQSAFNHAFKRWTGQSPGQYAKRLKADETACRK